MTRFITFWILSTGLLMASAKSGPELTAPAKKLRYHEMDNPLETGRRYRALENWAKKEGVDMSRIGVAVDTSTGAAHYAGGQTLAMRREVRKGEQVLRIPRKICMSTDDAAVDKEIGEYIKSIPPLWRLSIWLLHHKLIRLEKSEYAAYVRALPPVVSLPITYTDTEMRWLNGTRTVAMVQAQRRDIENSFREHMMGLTRKVPKIFPPELFIAQEWQWAVAIVTSRGFKHQSEGHEVIYTLVPVLDMANHEAKNMPIEARQKLHVRTEEGDRIVYAGTNLRQGSEFHNDYGVLSSEDLLLSYGYVPLVNLDNFYAFSIDMRGALPEAKRILRDVGALDAKGKVLVPLRLYQEGISPGVLAMHRVALLSKQEVPKAGLALEGKEIGPGNDLRVAITLKDMCASLITRLGDPKAEEARTEQIAAMTAAEKVRARAELAALRYRQQLRKILSRNHAMFLEMQRTASAQLGMRDEV